MMARCNILMRLAFAAVVVSSLSLCKQPHRKAETGWRPSWMDKPPAFPGDLDLEPWEPTGTDEVELRWKFGDGEFGYDMINRVQIKVAQGGQGGIETEARGELDLNPQPSGKAFLTMTSRLGSGMGNPYTKIYTIDTQGRLDTPDPRSQNILDLIFPMYPEPLSPGEKYVTDHVVPDQDGTAETRGATTLGIVGFTKLSGRSCAIVAAEHEGHIWSEIDGQMSDTGSVRNIELLGYFDIEAGLYVAVAIREHSLTKAGTGERTTDRHATYMLRGL